MFSIEYGVGFRELLCIKRQCSKQFSESLSYQPMDMAGLLSSGTFFSVQCLEFFIVKVAHFLVYIYSKIFLWFLRKVLFPRFISSLFVVGLQKYANVCIFFLSRVTIAVMKHHLTKQVGKNMVYTLAYTSTS